jgi:hypothetical protein
MMTRYRLHPFLLFSQIWDKYIQKNRFLLSLCITANSYILGRVRQPFSSGRLSDSLFSSIVVLKFVCDRQRKRSMFLLHLTPLRKEIFSNTQPACKSFKSILIISVLACSGLSLPISGCSLVLHFRVVLPTIEKTKNSSPKFLINVH